MLYRIEFIKHMTKTFRIHVQEKLVELTPDGEFLLFDFLDAGVKELVAEGLPQYVCDLMNTDGIERVGIALHTIEIWIGEVFGLNDVWPAIHFHLENSVARGTGLKEAGEPFMVVMDEKGVVRRKLIQPKTPATSVAKKG